MASLLLQLRSGDWITRERARLWSLALLAASLCGVVFLLATSDGLNDYQGRPLGTDFSNIYAGGTYVLDGQPGTAFDPPSQHAREQMIFGKDTPFYGWCYPPFLLFVAAALALLPYAAALAVWQASTMLLYLGMLWAVLRFSPARENEGRALTHDPMWLLLAIAFPAVFVNLGHGHNGFLTAALMGTALLTLNRKPVLAGILFGLLSYKPQFGVMIPLVLIATGRWRACASATATVLVLALVSTLAFGPDVWRHFINAMPFTREVLLEQGGTGWHKIQSVFSWARMWGAGIPLAYAAQAAVTLALGLALAWLWRSDASYRLKAAALPIASILATPYSLDYDLMALAPAIAFLALEGYERGFRAWEKTALAFMWFMPLIARTVAEQTLIPLAVPAMAIVFVLLLRRAAEDTGAYGRWQSAAHPIK
jgi:alpha-1,2-mannosyltransferase